jgi:hypothetical protein
MSLLNKHRLVDSSRLSINPSVCPHKFTGLPLKNLFVIFHILDFDKNVATYSDSDYNWTETPHALHEYLKTYARVVFVMEAYCVLCDVLSKA